jgi:hypothetical protein
MNVTRSGRGEDRGRQDFLVRIAIALAMFFGFLVR